MEEGKRSLWDKGLLWEEEGRKGTESRGERRVGEKKLVGVAPDQG
jgi:hypothetical protein